ncbi:pancreatic alpha-amylase-like [Platysternon megacephalum]|uniref:Pancreatic alpha-amylase-like n=1 Tax=Platysternon megacephalum TaxID=55544 RepID=A0A4D9E696_9SAUR|nr:pancreatic alpha-amylase-like [Platysternon megacephalum]
MLHIINPARSPHHWNMGTERESCLGLWGFRILPLPDCTDGSSPPPPPTRATPAVPYPTARGGPKRPDISALVLREAATDDRVFRGKKLVPLWGTATLPALSPPTPTPRGTGSLGHLLYPPKGTGDQGSE